MNKDLTNEDGEVRELTADDFKNAKPFKGVYPEIVAAQKAGELRLKPMGRPKLANPKKSVTLRLDPVVIEHFKQGGKGWQTRLNAALREYVDKAA